jgi:hypothetical protein
MIIRYFASNAKKELRTVDNRPGLSAAVETTDDSWSI